MRLPLPTPAGDIFPLFEYPRQTFRILRPVQDEVWAELRLFRTQSVCRGLVSRRHRGRTENSKARLANMIAACTEQAEDLFWLAEEASSNTAPLLHYYSMLNLAKALIYLEDPNHLRELPDLHHGLTMGPILLPYE